MHATPILRQTRSVPSLLWAIFFLTLGASLSSSEAIGQEAERPNVILFIGDDINWNDYGCYGNQSARTPRIDALSKAGVRFSSAFLTASSCSPSRSSIVTGRYPHNNGAASELHQPISAHLPWFPALLRESGYYTALAGKHHMSVVNGGDRPSWRDRAFDLVDPSRAPGNSGGHASWVDVVKKRPRDKPFFFWFAAYDAHRGWDADRQWKDEYGPKHQPNSVVVPSFLSDDAQTRKDLASYYNEVTRFDHHIGKVVDELKSQQALENTLIFVLADNGRPFPRAKTRLHDSGMQTGLVAHWPAKIKKPGIHKGLVSAIDLAPTILSAAGVKQPETMQGVSLQPVLEDVTADAVRNYAFSEHNWHDYEAHGRSVRHKNFVFIRNRRPYQAWQGPADSVRSPSHQQLLSLRKANQLTAAQSDVFLAPRPAVELYDREQDPHQLKNLAGAGHPMELHLTKMLKRWERETADSAPAKLSQDSFHRESGDRLKVKDYRGDWPGKDLRSDHVNQPGPR